MAIKLLTTKKFKKSILVKNVDICNIIFALTILLLTYLPFGFGLMYLTSCNMHFLNIVMPDLTCGTYKNIFHWFIHGFINHDQSPIENCYILFRVFLLTLLQVYFFTPGFAAISICCSMLYPVAFYTLEMLKMLK